jgi:hypothetical protein
MAHPTGFEGVTFAFGGKSPFLRRDSLERDIIREGTDLVIKYEPRNGPDYLPRGDIVAPMTGQERKETCTAT